MKKLTLVIFALLNLVACGTINFKATGNQSVSDYEQARYICENSITPNNETQAAQDTSNQTPPTYRTNVNCNRIGDNVYCNGTSTPDNNGSGAAKLGAALGTLIGKSIKAVQDRSEFKDCMAKYGFVPKDFFEKEEKSSSTNIKESENTSNLLTREQESIELQKIKEISYKENLVKKNTKLKIKFKEDEIIIDFFEYENNEDGYSRTFFNEDGKISISLNGDFCANAFSNFKISKNGQISLYTFKNNNQLACSGNIETPKLKQYITDTNVIGVYSYINN